MPGARVIPFGHDESKAMIRLKRSYDPPLPDDGERVLVERLWPRGMKKESLSADAWLKEVAPSTELRKWFGHRVERWDAFRRRYREELAANQSAWQPIVEASQRGTVTLLYSARDELHNGVRVLRDYLLEREASRSDTAKPHRRAPARSAPKKSGSRRIATRGRARRSVRGRVS
jgi:uncharacterized protein YeaO (DUF488 family)